MNVETGPRIEEVAPPPEGRFDRLLERASAELRASALLESGERAGELGRWSFFALTVGEPQHLPPFGEDDGLDRLERALAQVRGDASAASWRARRESASIPFAGGVIAALGYEYCTRFERIRNRRAAKHAAPNLTGGLWFVPVRHVLALDHTCGRAWVAGSPHGFTAALERLEGWRREVTQSTPRSPSDPALPSRPITFRSSLERSAYERAVEQAIEWILAGDIFEVNLSRRIEVEHPREPLAVYRRLAAETAGPFSAWLSSAAWTIVSVSPERLLRLATDRLETRPIKGTRARGRNAHEDARLLRALCTSEKDLAELAMIVDLERNDLGRIARTGSVVVRAAAEPVSFRAVHHLVGHVEATLEPDTPLRAVLAACLPGGSITGAPKPRAMEIIEALEPVARGIYTGAIGWFGADGDFDLNVAIRTIVFEGKRAHFGTGGAVTAESDPAAEFEETCVKGAALARALGFEIDAPPRALVRGVAGT